MSFSIPRDALQREGSPVSSLSSRPQKKGERRRGGRRRCRGARFKFTCAAPAACSQWLPAQSRKHRTQLESGNSIEKRRDSVCRSVRHRATQNGEPTGIKRCDSAIPYIAVFTKTCVRGFERLCRQRNVAVAAASAAQGGQYTTARRRRGKGRHVASELGRSA